MIYPGISTISTHYSHSSFRRICSNLVLEFRLLVIDTYSKAITLSGLITKAKVFPKLVLLVHNQAEQTIIFERYNINSVIFNGTESEMRLELKKNPDLYLGCLTHQRNVLDYYYYY